MPGHPVKGPIGAGGEQNRTFLCVNLIEDTDCIVPSLMGWGKVHLIHMNQL